MATDSKLCNEYDTLSHAIGQSGINIKGHGTHPSHYPFSKPPPIGYLTEGQAKITDNENSKKVIDVKTSGLMRTGALLAGTAARILEKRITGFIAPVEPMNVRFANSGSSNLLDGFYPRYCTR